MTSRVVFDLMLVNQPLVKMLVFLPGPFVLVA